MRRCVLTLLLSLMALGASAGNPLKPLQRVLAGADSVLRKMYHKVDYDTAYISRSPGKIGLKAWGSLSGASLRADGDKTNARLRTDMRGTLSLEFDYYDLAVEVATNPTSFSGRNHDFEINFNFYPRRFVFDVCFQKAQTAFGSFSYRDISSDVDKGWLDTKYLYIDAYYTFNFRHFSYDAPFYQFYQQKKSVGSWLAGLSYQGGSIRTTCDVPADIPESRFGAQHIAIGGGYAYNFVASRRWLFHLSFVPNLVVWSNNTIEMDGTKTHTPTKFPTVLVNGRMGFVYYFCPSRFMGFYAVGNRLLKQKSETELRENKWILRVFYGMRI